MIVHEGIFNSRIRLLHYIGKHLSVWGNSLPYMGANLLYGSLSVGIYTRKSDLYRAGVIILTL